MTVQQRILVTGASGFVGKALLQRLIENQTVDVVAASRTHISSGNRGVDAVAIGDIGPETDWRTALSRVDTVVHLAARVHVMHDRSANPLSDFRIANVAATMQLARQSAEFGVRRFIYISSIKVNGEFTRAGRPFRAEDHPGPMDPYGVSKLEAELELRQFAEETGLQVVVVRPPLVYGPGVRANFRNMMGWLDRGLPLPFGAVDNQRSIIGLDNLCDLISVCTQHPAAAGKTFLASDGEDVSTTDLLRRLGKALGKPARLLPLPHGLLMAALSAIGQRNVVQRLCSSLQVDIAPTRTLLGWAPPVSLDEGLRRTAQAFLAEAR